MKPSLRTLILGLGVGSTLALAQDGRGTGYVRYRMGLRSGVSTNPCAVAKGEAVDDGKALSCYRHIQNAYIEPLSRELAQVRTKLGTAREKNLSFAKYYETDHYSKLTIGQEIENAWHRNVTRRVVPLPMPEPNERTLVITDDDRLYLDSVAAIQRFQNLLYGNDTLVNNLDEDLFDYGRNINRPYAFAQLIGCGGCYRWLDFATRNINQTRSLYLQLLQVVWVDFADILPLNHLNRFEVLKTENIRTWLSGIGRWVRANTGKSTIETYFFNDDDRAVLEQDIQALSTHLGMLAPVMEYYPQIDTLKNKEELARASATINRFVSAVVVANSYDIWSEFEGNTFPSSYSRQMRKILDAIDRRAQDAKAKLNEKSKHIKG